MSPQLTEPLFKVLTAFSEKQLGFSVINDKEFHEVQGKCPGVGTS